MTNAPKRTQSKIRMIKGNLNWIKRKFTVTDCMFAREIPAINKIKSNKYTIKNYEVYQKLIKKDLKEDYKNLIKLDIGITLKGKLTLFLLNIL